MEGGRERGERGKRRGRVGGGREEKEVRGEGGWVEGERRKR